jgi:hypothetical protein
MRIAFLLVLMVIVILGGAFLRAVGRGYLGEPVPRGEVTEAAVPAATIEARKAAHKQILFGDLHVHTSFSWDAFSLGLPIVNGEGVHPPADACDFARFCAGLDFWAITDHAESITPRTWRETRQMIRECNAVAGAGENPDVVAFLGWEWTQVGRTPETHYGHKNVILRDTEEGSVPVRPIAAGGLPLQLMRARSSLGERLMPALLDWPNRQTYYDRARFQEDMLAVPMCREGVDVRALPAECTEVAETPDALFEKLRQWGSDALVIPHGNSWGLYTPAGSTWDRQLRGELHDPELQTLIEVYSGHGSSEEYRDWRHVARDADGNASCPSPTEDFTPCCWRAGELIRARCGDLSADECETRVREARQNFVDAGLTGMETVPGTTVEDWLDCGVDRTTYNPTLEHRPGGSAQYALAISSFDEGEPRRFRFGFIGSSDNHTSRPGTGYKELRRHGMVDAAGARDESWYRRLTPDRGEPLPRSIAWDPSRPLDFFGRLAFERQASFFLTGGLAAVHADGRKRDSIWQALERKEVYATSGARILLWFDVINGPEGVAPMGSEIPMRRAPRFRVRAAGALKQRPGCPEHVTGSLSPERLERICLGECYNPSDERHLIKWIEVVRIRPQVRADESVGERIEDPWKTFTCQPNPAGCIALFEDPEFVGAGREFVYYARAIQEPTPMINAANVRCTYDEAGNCVEVDPCYASYLTPFTDDCLTPSEERAWSSPIFVRPER